MPLEDSLYDNDDKLPSHQQAAFERHLANEMYLERKRLGLTGSPMPTPKEYDTLELISFAQVGLKKCSSFEEAQKIFGDLAQVGYQLDKDPKRMSEADLQGYLTRVQTFIALKLNRTCPDVLKNIIIENNLQKEFPYIKLD